MYNASIVKNALFVLFLFLLGAAALSHSISKRSDCFSPEYVSVDAAFFLSMADKYIPREPPEGIHKILEQPFTFLGSGNQCFAFESQDKRTVLKLIKFHSLLRLDGFDFLPAIGNLKKVKLEHAIKRQAKLERVVNGFALADAVSRESSGLIYVHMHPLRAADFKVLAIDKAGRKHLLELNHLIFALQKKAVPTGALLSAHFDEDQPELAIAKIHSLLAFIKTDLEKGVYDEDHNIIHNTGFVDETPIRIDVGKLTMKPEFKDPVLQKKELRKIASERILPWIERHHPAYKKDVAVAMAIYLDH